MWTLDHLLDLMADFLRFYSIKIDPAFDDYSDLTGPRFFAFAHRVTAYEGVMSRRVEILSEKQDEERRLDAPRTPRDGSGKRVKTSTASDWYKQRTIKTKPSDIENIIALAGGEIQR